MDLKNKNTLFYLTVGGFTVLIYWIITKENCWKKEPDSFRNGKWFMECISSMKHNFDDP
jgi:hypothetical protein